jgi:hypothetical protein
MNMIEKVARAIFASEGMVYTDDERMFEPFPYDELDEIEQATFTHKAKAAIEAMREPTETMLDVGDEAMTSTGFSRQVYSRMIDAALEGK